MPSLDIIVSSQYITISVKKKERKKNSAGKPITIKDPGSMASHICRLARHCLRKRLLADILLADVR